MQIFLLALSVVLILAIFLLSLRIVLGWFAPQALGRAWRLIAAVTDPWLELFRGLRFLRAGMLDFTPVAAILALVVALVFVSTLMNFGRITVGFVLSAILQAVLSGAESILVFGLAVIAVRLLPFLVRSMASSPVWRSMDAAIQPVIDRVAGLVRVGPRAPWAQRLLAAFALLLAAFLLVHFPLRLAVLQLERLPF